MIILSPALKRILILCVVMTLGAGLSTGAAAQSPDVALSDDQLRRAMIRQSIAQYSGVCACPYSRMRSGRRCGKRSAYSKPCGHAPLCYPKDISGAMLRRFRGR